jgi:hypothetical protein
VAHKERPTLPLNFKMVLGVANILIAIRKFVEDTNPMVSHPVPIRLLKMMNITDTTPIWRFGIDSVGSVTILDSVPLSSVP